MGRCHQSFTTTPRPGSQSLVSLALEVTRDDDRAQPITGGVFTLSAASNPRLGAFVHVLDEACDMGCFFSKNKGKAVQGAQVRQSCRPNLQSSRGSLPTDPYLLPMRLQAEVTRIKDLLTETAHKTPGYWERTQYVPIDQIVDILNVTTVSALLPICAPGIPQSDYSNLARRICGADVKRTREMGDTDAYDRILAILLLMGQERMLPAFMDKEMKINNGKLPLNKENPLLGRVQGWGNSEKYRFREQQWKVLAPILGPEPVTQTERHYEFPYDQPLPFVKMNKPPMEGSFGSVQATTIHKAHTRFHKHTVSSTRPSWC